MLVSEDEEGKLHGFEVVSVSGGAQYENGFPKELTLSPLNDYQPCKYVQAHPARDVPAGVEARVREEFETVVKLEGRACIDSAIMLVMSPIEAEKAEARDAALEEAASYHDSRADNYEQEDSRANFFEIQHERGSAKDIRALRIPQK